MSAIQAAERAETMGVHLPYGTIAAYWSGSHGRPSAKTLKALARVVPFTEEQLQRAAWNTSEVLGPWVPPEESALLDKATRKALNALIKSVVAAKGEHRVVPTAQASESDASPETVEGQEVGGSADDGQSGTPDLQSTVAGVAAELQVEDGDQSQEKSG